MKTILLILVFIAFGAQAQTTHDLNWQIGIGTNVDLTIEVGDTVRWTWTDSAPHTVENDTGSTETFDSGTLTGNGLSYSYQFLLVGTNPYFCSFHPGSMSGTITVEETLDVDEFLLKNFSISPNPATTQIFLKLPDDIITKTISIYNVIGQEVYSNESAENSIDVSSLSKGLYFLNIKAKTLNQTKQFIKI